MRQFRRDDYLKIKAATRTLLKAAGGIEAAADNTRVAKSLLSSAQNINAETFLPVDALADLTHESGEVALLRAIAQLCGYALVPLEQDGDEADLKAAMLGAQTESGEAANENMRALIDGRIDHDELPGIIKENDDAARHHQNVADLARKLRAGNALEFSE